MEFNYLGFELDKTRTGEAENCRKGVGGRKVMGTIRPHMNARSFLLE